MNSWARRPFFPGKAQLLPSDDRWLTTAMGGIAKASVRISYCLRVTSLELFLLFKVAVFRVYSHLKDASRMGGRGEGKFVMFETNLVKLLNSLYWSSHSPLNVIFLKRGR